MNEQLQKSLSSLIDKIVKTAENAGDFLISEIPDVVHQLLLWHGVKGAILFVFYACMFGLAAYLLKMSKTVTEREGYTWFADNEVDPSSGAFFVFCLWVVSAALFLISVLRIDLDWLQIWIAPKVWLLEYAKDIIK